MAERTKPPARSSEEELLHQHYNKLLNDIFWPERLAELLVADGIISSETKEIVTSKRGVERTRTLLDAVQHALENAPNPEQTFQRLLVALRVTCDDSVRNKMEGECAISLEAVA